MELIVAIVVIVIIGACLLYIALGLIIHFTVWAWRALTK
jgi:hypothetical protein